MVKRALVLGGGGMFAAFQAGAWRELSRRFQPDAVVGASAGALNAWMIASGVSGEELCTMWSTLEQKAGLKWPRYWGDGILETSGLEAFVGQLTERYRPKMRLGVTVCEGPRLANRVYWDAEVTVEHLLASCAVPGLLAAKRLEGGLSFDGGLRTVCPVWAAEEIGAEEIVVVNVWKHFAWRNRGEDGPNVRRIEPRERLGSLRDSAVWERGRIERWIAQGEAAAR